MCYSNYVVAHYGYELLNYCLTLKSLDSTVVKISFVSRQTPSPHIPVFDTEIFFSGNRIYCIHVGASSCHDLINMHEHP